MNPMDRRKLIQHAGMAGVLAAVAEKRGGGATAEAEAAAPAA